MMYTIYRKNKKMLSKLMVLLLVFTFFITPLAPVFAEAPSASPLPSPSITVPAGDTAPSVSGDNTAPAPMPTNSPAPKITSDSADTSSVNQTQSDKSSDSPSNDSSAGKLNTTSALSADQNPNISVTSPSSPIKQIIPQPDPTTGALTYSYPITVPPGRNGMQPDLKLQYNSQDTTQDSIFGYSWSLNIPSITRVNKKGTNTIFTDNYFSSSLSGELVNVSGATYVPKVENGDFLKYTFASNTWTVTDKSGTVYTFGSQSSTRQDNPGDSNQIYKWMLEKVQDTSGNFVAYAYYKDAGQIYPDTVSYGGIYQIIFNRSSRTDQYAGYQMAFLETTNYIVSNIQVIANGQISKSYSLAYSNNLTNNRSRLMNIVLTASGVVYPATSFNYQLENPSWQFDQTSWPQLPVPAHGDLHSQDLNGDSYPDFFVADGNGNKYCFLNDSKFIFIENPANKRWDYVSEMPPLFEQCNWIVNGDADGGARLGDLNGDLLPDVVKDYYESHNFYTGLPGVTENKGNFINEHGYISSNTGNWDTVYPIVSDGNEISALFDANGDGFADYISSNNATYQLNNGSSFNPPQTIAGFPISYFTIHNTPNYIKIADVNSDGLPDILAGQVTYINQGNFNWISDPVWASPLPMTASGINWPQINPLQFVDVNGDGRVDIVTDPNVVSWGGSPWGTYINNGHGWTKQASWDFPILNNECSFATTGSRRTFLNDSNGDGMVDCLFGYSYEHPAAALVNLSPVPDLLSSISLPTGGLVSITYKSSAQYVNNNGALSNPNLPFVVQTVNTITTTDPVNNVSGIDTYTYADGSFYFDAVNPFTRKFAGFGTITKTDSAGNVTKTYFHQGNASDSTQGEYQDDYWKIGKVYRTEQYDNAGHLYAKTINKWDDTDLGGGSKFVKLAQTLAQTYDGDSTHKDTAQSYAYDTANGNVTQKVQYGQVQGNDDGTFFDTGTDAFTTTISYTAGGSIMGLPSQQTVTDQNSVKVKESKFYYDLQALGIVIQGNLTKQEDWKSGTAYINAQKTYNSYGLVTSSTDPNANTTTYTYDVYNLYLATVTNPKLQTTNYNYDYASGQVTQKVDANARVFQYVYDGLGRLQEEKQPDMTTPTTLVTKTIYTYMDTPNAVAVKASNYLDAFNSADSYVYFDGLGRKIQERQEADGSNFSVKDINYNNLGQVQKESLPYFSSSLSRTLPTSDSTLYTSSAYDPLGRVVTVTNSVGTTTNTYNDWKTTVTDANGKSKDFYKDAYGALVQVDEHNLGNTYSTYYQYNYLGNLAQITDALQNIRNFTYDGLGRKLSAQDLHAPADTTFGAFAYTYDDAGNLTQTIDPKNQTITNTYDALNRQLTQNYTTSAGTEVTYAYDAGTDGIGRLASTTTNYPQQTAQITANTYNPLGFLKTESKVIDSATYTTTYDYDRQGNQILVTNPDGSQIKNMYNAAGQLDKTQRKESGDTNFVDVVSNFDYSPTGQIALQSDANGAISTNTYDATKLYRLTHKVTTDSTGAHIQDLAYTYDPAGNITQLIDASATAAAKTSQYVYDDLYRLTSATITNSASGQQNYSQAFTYNALGNILTKSETMGSNPQVISTYTYAGNTGASFANPDAVTSITDGSTATNYTYDNNGNMTQEGPSVGSGQGNKSYTFDYNNRLTQVSLPSAPVTTTFYPTVGDGSIYYNAYTSWNTAHNAYSGTLANSTGGTFYATTGKSGPLPSPTPTPSGDDPSDNYFIERAFLPFNTSALPDNASITDAKLKTYVDSKLDANNDGKDWVSVVGSTQPSTTALATSDYHLDGNITNPAEGIDTAERKDITNVTTGQYLIFNLNATGKSWISKTASTKLGLREGHDILNVPFGGTSGQYNQLKIRSSEYSGTSSDPILEVTYTVPTVINYAYDAQGQRIKMVSPAPAGAGQTVTTVYPTKLYNTNGTTPTKHIAGIATVQGTGINAKIYYNHSDSLNSSSVMTDSVGATAETMDYFPFGAIRIDSKPTPPPGTLAFSEQRKYIGQEYDPDTNLSYLNARYYNATLARFISQDTLARDYPEKLLADPQSLNEYSYARNNPIALSDPTGKSWTTFGQGIAFSLGVALVTAGAIAALPVAIPAAVITGVAILGTTAVTYGAYQNYNAYASGQISKDQFDYNSGFMLGGLVLPYGLGKIAEAGETVNLSRFRELMPETEGVVMKEGIFHRNASGTADSLTPRPGIDTSGSKAGLSGWDSIDKLQKGKSVQVDVSKLPTDLQAIRSSDGHISILPKTQGELNAWAASRGTDQTSGYTKAIQGAVIKK